jgi:hypothetical protein
MNHLQGRARLLPPAVMACLGLLLGGCLFEARDPEPPTSLAIDYLPRSSAENIWENCRLALNNRDTGGWDTAVSENFVYVPDSDTEQAYPAVDWANWDKDAEMDFINSWFASGVTIVADLRDTDINTPPGDGGVAEWEIIYLLTVEDAQTGSITRYRGSAVLEFTLEGSYYFLSYWRDEQGEEDPDTGAPLETMGRLRGAFGS